MKGPLLQFDGWPPRIGLHGTRPRYQTRGSSVSTLGHSRLFTTQVSTLALGSQDEDYPFACPPGVRGSHGNADEIETQISPVCVGACPAGSMCSSATHTPRRTPHQGSNLRASEISATVLRTHPRNCVAQLARKAPTAPAARPRGLSAHRGPLATGRTSRPWRIAIPAPLATTALAARPTAAPGRPTTHWSPSFFRRHASIVQRTL